MFRKEKNFALLYYIWQGKKKRGNVHLRKKKKEKMKKKKKAQPHKYGTGDVITSFQKNFLLLKRWLIVLEDKHTLMSLAKLGYGRKLWSKTSWSYFLKCLLVFEIVCFCLMGELIITGQNRSRLWSNWLPAGQLKHILHWRLIDGVFQLLRELLEKIETQHVYFRLYWYWDRNWEQILILYVHPYLQMSGC